VETRDTDTGSLLVAASGRGSETEDAGALGRSLAAALGLSVATEAVHGSGPGVAVALDRRARDIRAELIVLGGPVGPGPGRIITGDVALALLHRAECPVAIAPPGFAERADPRLLRVAVAFDGGNESVAALEVAIELAVRSRARLSILSAADTFGHRFASSMAAGGGGAGLVEVDRRTMDRVLRMGVDMVPPDLPVDSRLLLGSVAGIASECSGDDLLVAGSRAHGRLGRAVLGSTSAKLIERAEGPVLIVPRRAAIAAAVVAEQPEETEPGPVPLV
jgi:nucleotide-binding universal stress UspA family protein